MNDSPMKPPAVLAPNNVLHLSFCGRVIYFRPDGWFNATIAASAFGKQVQDYQDNKETAAYVAALARHLNHANERDLIRTARGRGGGTWFHPKLAVHFARWLDLEFSIWCDQQIDQLLRGHGDWSRSRHQAAASYKVMQEVMRSGRELEGKGTSFYHYANEAKLVNWALVGEFKPVNREALSFTELNLLADLEIHNTLLLARGLDRDSRKAQLLQRANSHTLKLPLARVKMPSLPNAA